VALGCGCVWICVSNGCDACVVGGWGRTLADNPIDCSDLCWMTSSVKELMGNAESVYGSGYPSCETPSDKRGTSLRDIEVSVASCVLTTETPTTPTTSTTTTTTETPGGCPSACSCEGTRINCESRELTSIPADINTWNPASVERM
jgi:hypothetical protein